MLGNLNDVLLPAKKAKYAVGLFNAVNLELARGIIRAAEETQSPVIVGTAEVLFPYGPLEEVSYYLLPMAKKAGVPVVVHLDHGLNRETCLKALELGFSSIMYDCSTDSYEENVRKVKEMAEIAHSYGATIEGELGHVGDNEDMTDDGTSSKDPSMYYTDPKMALDFVQKTGVDALAVAVGPMEHINFLQNWISPGSGKSPQLWTCLSCFTEVPDLPIWILRQLSEKVSAK